MNFASKKTKQNSAKIQNKNTRFKNGMLLLSFIHTKHRHKICCLHCAVFNRQICNAQLDLTLIVMQQWLAENRKKKHMRLPTILPKDSLPIYYSFKIQKYFSFNERERENLLVAIDVQWNGNRDKWCYIYIQMKPLSLASILYFHFPMETKCWSEFDSITKSETTWNKWELIFD